MTFLLFYHLFTWTAPTYRHHMQIRLKHMYHMEKHSSTATIHATIRDSRYFFFCIPSMSLLKEGTLLAMLDTPELLPLREPRWDDREFFVSNAFEMTSCTPRNALAANIRYSRETSTRRTYCVPLSEQSSHIAIFSSSSTVVMMQQLHTLSLARNGGLISILFSRYSAAPYSSVFEFLHVITMNLFESLQRAALVRTWTWILELPHCRDNLPHLQPWHNAPGERKIEPPQDRDESRPTCALPLCSLITDFLHH